MAVTRSSSRIPMISTGNRRQADHNSPAVQARDNLMGTTGRKNNQIPHLTAIRMQWAGACNPAKWEMIPNAMTATGNTIPTKIPAETNN
jgi:hypothetical protein